MMYAWPLARGKLRCLGPSDWHLHILTCLLLQDVYEYFAKSYLQWQYVRQMLWFIHFCCSVSARFRKLCINKFAVRCYASVAYVVVRYLSVSVTFVNYVKTNKHNFKICSPWDSQTILICPHQMAWQYSDGNPLEGGIECRWNRQKSRFWAYIWLHCILSKLRPARCYQHGTAGPWSHKLWHLSLVVSVSLWILGDGDKMFITRSLNVTPKTTEQHLIACSDKSGAYVTNNKRLLDVLYYWR